jgi:hypothetical protein
MKNLLFLVLLFALAMIFAPAAQAQTASCPWQSSVAPDVVRSPIQMDIHAAYRIFSFQSDGTVGYTVRGEYPLAAFLSFTTYNAAGELHAARLDYRIDADPGSINPFRPTALVNAKNRSYTLTVLPEGTVPDASMPNPIFMPPPPRGLTLVTAVLVERIYLAEPRVNDRFGGVDPPVIEPFLVSRPWIPAACPSGDFSAIADQFGSLAPNFSQPPLPRDGKIEFYRPPASGVPFADGSGPLTEKDCTSYLMATVFSDQLAVVHLPALPFFFDNTRTGPKTTFGNYQARYISLGSYGASPLSASENENVAGPGMIRLPDGSAKFVIIPIGLSPSVKQQVADKAAGLGYNVMPLADEHAVINGIKPFLIYRSKVPADGFVGSVLNVACYQGSNIKHAPSNFAASPSNMGPYAPVGVECSVRDFLFAGCGQ